MYVVPSSSVCYLRSSRLPKSAILSIKSLVVSTYTLLLVQRQYHAFSSFQITIWSFLDAWYNSTCKRFGPYLVNESLSCSESGLIWKLRKNAVEYVERRQLHQCCCVTINRKSSTWYMVQIPTCVEINTKCHCRQVYVSILYNWYKCTLCAICTCYYPLLVELFSVPRAKRSETMTETSFILNKKRRY